MLQNKGQVVIKGPIRRTCHAFIFCHTVYMVRFGISQLEFVDGGTLYRFWLESGAFRVSGCHKVVESDSRESFRTGSLAHCAILFASIEAIECTASCDCHTHLRSAVLLHDGEAVRET